MWALELLFCTAVLAWVGYAEWRDHVHQRCLEVDTVRALILKAQFDNGDIRCLKPRSSATH